MAFNLLFRQVWCVYKINFWLCVIAEIHFTRNGNIEYASLQFYSFLFVTMVTDITFSFYVATDCYKYTTIVFMEEMFPQRLSKK